MSEKSSRSRRSDDGAPALYSAGDIAIARSCIRSGARGQRQCRPFLAMLARLGARSNSALRRRRAARTADTACAGLARAPERHLPDYRR